METAEKHNKIKKKKNNEEKLLWISCYIYHFKWNVREWVALGGLGEKMITFVEIVKGNPGGSNNNNNNNKITCYLMITQNVT